jgi:hypothetical protein
MIEHIYRVGYVTAEKGKKYSPRENAVVIHAKNIFERYKKLAESVADGNFNQADVIAEAKSLCENTIKAQ